MAHRAPDTWSKVLRGGGASERPAPLSARSRSTSFARDLSPNPGVARPRASAVGAEARLLALEGQLRALRAEHDALRRCLDQAGVLTAAAVEQELKASAAQAPVAAASSPPAAAGSTAAPAVVRQPARSTADREPGSPRADAAPQDSNLYSILKPLINGRGGAAEHRALQRALQSSAPPNEWAGPGTPLNASVQAGRPDLVKQLLRARASPNRPDQRGVTSLHLAVFDGGYEMCRLLLAAAADVQSTDRHGQTPLFFAPDQDICKLLVARRADVAALNHKGQTALHLAGRAGLKDVYSYLSSQMTGALADHTDMHGATALEYAKQAGASWADTSTAFSASRGRGATSAAARPVQAKSSIPMPPSPRGRSSTGARQSPRGGVPESPGLDKKVLKGGGGGRAAGGAGASSIPRSAGAPGERRELLRADPAPAQQAAAEAEAAPPGPATASASQDGGHSEDEGDVRYFDISAGSRRGSTLDGRRQSMEADIMAMYGGLGEDAAARELAAALARARAEGGAAASTRGLLDIGIFDGDEEAAAPHIERPGPPEAGEEDTGGNLEEQQAADQKLIEEDLDDECW